MKIEDNDESVDRKIVENTEVVTNGDKCSDKIGR